jgi:hypothetical protein
LVVRLRNLQPYHRHDADNHPLRVLAEHTNLAKHRAPAVAATFVAKVIPDVADPDIVINPNSGRPVQPGDTLVTGPPNTRVPLSIWPMVSIQRPHTGAWQVLVKELGYLEEWVRTTAIPILIAGTRDVSPLPPQIDISVGHRDARAALAEARVVPASTRTERAISAAVARDGMVDALSVHPDAPPVAAIAAWAEALDDEQVLERQEQLARFRHRVQLRRLDTVVRKLLDEVRRHSD